MDSWYEWTVEYESGLEEVVNAMLVYEEVDALRELDDCFLVYVKNPDSAQQWTKKFKNINGVHSVSDPKLCPNENWNKQWESNYEAIEIPGICFIRAAFHAPNDKGLPEILIQPEMAFGTGHHATTYMMIQSMDSMKFEGKSVLDFGCGTGILSVFAMQKKANSVIGVDIEEPAIENANIHVDINGLSQASMEFKLGGLEVLSSNQKFNVILANINRRVLLDSASKLPVHLDTGGELLISGILDVDLPVIFPAFSKYFEYVDGRKRGDWHCLRWRLK